MIVGLEEMKAHLHVEEDADDDEITRLIETAESFIGGYVDCALTEQGAPAPVKQAAKMIVGRLFLDREAGLMDAESRVSDGSLDVFTLIAPWRRWAF